MSYMTRAEIDRLKGAIGRAIVKDPKSKVLQDMEKMILTIDHWRIVLEEIYKNEGPGLDGSSENASGRLARKALENS